MISNKCRTVCNENGIRTRTTLNGSEIEKDVNKPIAHVINGFFQITLKKNIVLLLNVFAKLSFIPQRELPDKNFNSCLLSLRCIKVGRN